MSNTGFIVDVFKVMVKDNASNDIIATSLLQDAQIQRQLQSTEIRSGVGNKLLGELYHDAATTISLTHVEYSYEFLARSIGQTITTGAGTAWSFQSNYTVDATHKVALTETPINVSDVFVKNASGVAVTGFTLTTKDLDLTAATPAVANGDVLSITYQYSSDPLTQTITFDDSVFGKGNTIILETLQVDGNGIPQYTVQYEFYSCVPDGQFTINTQSARNAVTQQQTFKVVNIAANGTTKVGEVRRIPVAS